MSRIALLFSLAMLMMLGGCSASGRIGGSTSEDEVIEELRKENAQLEAEVTSLQEKIDLRLAEIEALKAKDGRTAASPQGDADLPRLAVIRFDRYSGAIDTNDDGVDDTLRMWVLTFDQHERFLPTTGKAVLQAVAIRAEQDAKVVADNTWDAATFDKTYRSGFMGTHYRLDLPLPADLDPSLDALTVKLTFTDAATGVTLTREAGVRLKLQP